MNFTEALHAPTEAVLGYGRSRGKYRMKSDVGLGPLNVRIYIYIYISTALCLTLTAFQRPATSLCNSGELHHNDVETFVFPDHRVV